MTQEPTARVILPSLLAGPAVLLFFTGAEWSRQFTDPIELSPALPLLALLLLALASAVGLGPALISNLAGTILMIKLGNCFPLLRMPLAWAVVGGAVAWAVVDQLDFTPDWRFAFTAAGAVSALICRLRLA